MDVCVLCEKLVSSESSYVHYDCAHSFHMYCIETAIQVCPACKSQEPETLVDLGDDPNSAFAGTIQTSSATVPRTIAGEELCENEDRDKYAVIRAQTAKSGGVVVPYAAKQTGSYLGWTSKEWGQHLKLHVPLEELPTGKKGVVSVKKLVSVGVDLEAMLKNGYYVLELKAWAKTIKSLVRWGLTYALLRLYKDNMHPHQMKVIYRGQFNHKVVPGASFEALVALEYTAHELRLFGLKYKTLRKTYGLHRTNMHQFGFSPEDWSSSLGLKIPEDLQDMEFTDADMERCGFPKRLLGSVAARAAKTRNIKM